MSKPIPFKKTTAPEAGGWYQPPDESGPVQLPARDNDIQNYQAKGYKFLGYVTDSLATGTRPGRLDLK